MAQDFYIFPSTTDLLVGQTFIILTQKNVQNFYFFYSYMKQWILEQEFLCSYVSFHIDSSDFIPMQSKTIVFFHKRIAYLANKNMQSLLNKKIDHHIFWLLNPGNFKTFFNYIVEGLDLKLLVSQTIQSLIFIHLERSTPNRKLCEVP